MFMIKSRNNYITRYLTFFIGIVFMALGITLTTKADLGTTPITSLPYVASLGFTPSLGAFTVILNLVLVAIQVLVMRKKFPPLQFLQIPVSLLFGLLIDFWMSIVPDPVLHSYSYKLLFLFSGTLILAFGVFVEVSADVVMMAGEGAVMVMSLVSQRDFGLLKSIFDVTMVVLAGALSFILFHELKGIREGTVFSAVFVGIIVKFFFALKNKIGKKPVV